MKEVIEYDAKGVLLSMATHPVWPVIMNTPLGEVADQLWGCDYVPDPRLDGSSTYKSVLLHVDPYFIEDPLGDIEVRESDYRLCVRVSRWLPFTVELSRLEPDDLKHKLEKSLGCRINNFILSMELDSDGHYITCTYTFDRGSVECAFVYWAGEDPDRVRILIEVSLQTNGLQLSRSFLDGMGELKSLEAETN